MRALWGEKIYFFPLFTANLKLFFDKTSTPDAAFSIKVISGRPVTILRKTLSILFFQNFFGLRLNMNFGSVEGSTFFWIHYVWCLSNWVCYANFLYLRFVNQIVPKSLSGSKKMLQNIPEYLSTHWEMTSFFLAWVSEWTNFSHSPFHNSLWIEWLCTPCLASDQSVPLLW